MGSEEGKVKVRLTECDATRQRRACSTGTGEARRSAPVTVSGRFKVRGAVYGAVGEGAKQWLPSPVDVGGCARGVGVGGRASSDRSAPSRV